MPSSNTSPQLLSAQFSVSRASLLDEIAALVRLLTDTWAPEGYEDETGFHFGSDVCSSVEEPDWLGEHI
ncbi:MAG TPA: hypothetical protein VIM71_14740 [Lacunisphaera sp.]